MTRPALIRRELGLALAVLALWMLSLLAPLHLASGLLRERALAGFDISGAWSICVSLAQDEDGKARPPAVCPAHGIGKNDVAPPPPPVMLPAPDAASHDADFPANRVAPGGSRRFRPGQPRGPPFFA